MLYLRQLEGVGAVEWALQQNGWTPENKDRADDLGAWHFGIFREETEHWIDDEGRHMLGGVEITVTGDDDLQRQVDGWEKHFDVLKLFRDESDAYWASVGWDVTDGEGKQLEVMRLLDRQMVCLVKKLHVEARLNASAEDDAEAWGAQLAEEARQFRPRR